MEEPMDFRFSLFIATLFAIAIDSDGLQARQPNQTAETHKGELSSPGLALSTLDPTIAQLVALKGDPKKVQEFWQLLEDIAEKRGWKPELAKFQPLSPLLANVRAVTMELANERFVVVFLRTASGFIPGSDHQIAILLDSPGKRLDDLSCEINTRISHGFHEVVLDKPEDDGAQFLIRLSATDRIGNFDQTINHNGVRTRFLFTHELGSIARPPR
jgi:hypothetical protein